MMRRLRLRSCIEHFVDPDVVIHFAIRLHHVVVVWIKILILVRVGRLTLLKLFSMVLLIDRRRRMRKVFISCLLRSARRISSVVVLKHKRPGSLMTVDMASHSSLSIIIFTLSIPHSPFFHLASRFVHRINRVRVQAFQVWIRHGRGRRWWRIRIVLVSTAAPGARSGTGIFVVNVIYVTIVIVRASGSHAICICISLASVAAPAVRARIRLRWTRSSAV